MDDIFSPVPCLDPKSQKTIDNAVKKYSSFQRDFVWMAIKPSIRDEINMRWKLVEPYSESNFVTEFRQPSKFYSRLWELNLRYLLLSQLSRMPRNSEPDIISNSYVVECVVPAPTDVPELKLDGKLYNYPDEEIARRITNSLSSKLSQLNTRLSSSQRRIEYNISPYIIALNLPESNYMGAVGKSGMSIVEEMLMGIGPTQITIDTANDTVSSSISSRSTIDTRNGSTIEIGLFQKDEYKNVGAVLWTTKYLPHAEDLSILLNPNTNIALTGCEVLDLIHTVITYTRTDTGYTRNRPIS